MSAHRSLQPLSPLSANIVGSKHSYITKVGAGAHVDIHATMDAKATDDNTQDSGSVVSGLTSITGDDDFDRLMLQNARDEQRIQDALRGNVRPFSKARTHPRVGLTLDNLERNNAALGEAGMGRHGSPGSSNGSARSNPPYHPPAQWGRKGRVKRNWLRTITSDSEQQPGAQEDTADGLIEDATPRQTPLGADLPVPSIEDSPLSHKGSFRGTPVSNRRLPTQPQFESDGDYSIDFNEASLIASTPYMPRSHVLDDIRQREIESLREQALTTNRLDRIREASPAQAGRSRSSSGNATTSTYQENGAAGTESPFQDGSHSEIRSRKRTSSWKTIGKSQAVTGQTGQQITHSPITVYKKSSGSSGTVDSGHGDNSTRPVHRREDSHELLRRLARVSNTPSPRGNTVRPQTAPAKQPDSSSSLSSGPEPLPPTIEDLSGKELPQQQQPVEKVPINMPDFQNQDQPPIEGGQKPSTAPASSSQSEADDVYATPMPVKQSMVHAKTPMVTGAWIDTPAPKTAPRPTERSGPSTSPTKQSRQESPSKKHEEARPEEPKQEKEKEREEEVERIRPKLPKSALEAIVEEAKASGRERSHQDSLGDSTIDSLEDLITPAGEDSEGPDYEDDTLQGLQLPTEPPRNEAERVRQQELAQLHKMNQRLRAARTNIRDASRGMKRVESRVEHVETDGQDVKVVYRDCPCAAHGHGDIWTLAWTGFKRMFRDPMIQRRAGLTWLSIALLTFLGWFVLEIYACDKYCHQVYATKMVGYGTNPDAPDFPFVIPTLFYRWTIKPFRPFWEPLWDIVIWMLSEVYEFFFDQDTAARKLATATVQRMASKIVTQAIAETWEPDFSMDDDEVIF